MWTPIDRPARRAVLKRRIRRKLSGTAERPRVAVFRSLNHFYLQAVDDVAHRTLCSASTVDPEVRAQQKTGGNVAAAKLVGALIAARLKERGIETVVFDRGGYLYHGRVRAAAEAAREKGLKF
jgi:large subunit ribosomal protein L18